MTPSHIDRSTHAQLSFGYPFSKAFPVNRLDEGFTKHRQIAGKILSLSNTTEFMHYFHTGFKEELSLIKLGEEVNLSDLMTETTLNVIFKILVSDSISD